MLDPKRKSRMFLFIQGILFLVLAMPFMATAQSVVVHGQVIDGLSLENLAHVHVFKEAHFGTSTDLDGQFHFKANYLDTLHFSRMGYDSMAIVIGSTEKDQQMLLSMHQSTILLEGLEIQSNFQAATIIKRYQPQPMRVPGVQYSESVHEESYHLGLGAIASPMTAVYRLLSKSYKEEKKNHLYLKQKQIDDALYARASTNLDGAFKVIESYLDDYYYRDFIHYSGLTMRFVAESKEYDLIQILPQAIKSYYEHLDKADSIE